MTLLNGASEDSLLASVIGTVVVKDPPEQVGHGRVMVVYCVEFKAEECVIGGSDTVELVWASVVVANMVLFRTSGSVVA